MICNLQLQVQYLKMGITQCKTCEPERQQANMAIYSDFTSISELQQRYRKYAQINMLGLYNITVQKCIQRLFTLGQIHICDLIIRLTCQKKLKQRDRIIEDVNDIDLQQLDHLSLVQILPKNVHNILGINNNFEDEAISTAKPAKQSRDNFLKNFNPNGLNLLDKNSLKNKIGLQNALRILRKPDIFLIATIGCFGDESIIDSIDLPTGKSALRIMFQKIEAVNLKYQTNILLVCIVNPFFQKDFERQMELYMQQARGQQSQFLSQTPIRYQRILYKPPYPCISRNRKIEITSFNEIKFDYSNGDLIGFITRNPRLSILLEQHKYLQFINPSNILQSIISVQTIAYLQSNAEISIIAPVVVNMKGGESITENIRVTKRFIEKCSMNLRNIGQKAYRLIDSYYIKTDILSPKNAFFHKLISSKLKAQKRQSQSSSLIFNRSFENILFCPNTLLLIMNKFCSVSKQRQAIAYSNYCKEVLGIVQTKQQEIIQICPHVLFGPQQQLIQTSNKLRSLPTIGFPLVLNRQNIILKKST